MITPYLYAKFRNYPNHWVEQQYLPEQIKEERFYEPNDIGYEKEIKAYFRSIGKNSERYRYEDPSLGGNPDRPWEG